MDDSLIITSRELKEIHHALWYERFGNHGTVGHNLLILLAKFARHQGFWISEDGSLSQPENIVISEEKR